MDACMHILSKSPGHLGYLATAYPYLQTLDLRIIFHRLKMSACMSSGRPVITWVFLDNRAIGNADITTFAQFRKVRAERFLEDWSGVLL